LAAVAGLLGLVNIARTVAVLGGGREAGGFSETLARFDVAGPLLLVLGVVWARGAEPGQVRRRLVQLWCTWLAVTVIAVGVSHRDVDGSVVLSALAFRPWGAPAPGLGVGLVLFNIVTALALLGLIDLAARRRPAWTARSLAMGLVAAGAASRLVLEVVDGSDAGRLHGAASTLLGQLHWVGVGVLVAEWWPQRLGHVAADGRWTRALAATSPGLVLAGEAMFHLMARQYRERSVVVDGVTLLSGRLVTPYLWTVACAAALGVLICAGWALVAALRHSQMPSWLAGPLAASSAVSLGLVVRVYGLLAVAPERTDAGDPLFYHTTANVLATGRGMPEPLYWIAFQQNRPSAFHGPLYPIVLSLSSRLGGIAFFDHRMLSVLIGTGVVAAVWLLARHIGGPIVGLLAALVAACYPNLWLIDGLLYPEGLMTGLVVLCVYVAYRWRERPTWAAAAAIGALIALAALARGEGVLLGGLLAMPLMFGQRDMSWVRRWQHLVLAGITCLAVLAPWVLRNTAKFEHFVPLSNNGNEVMVYANCATAYDGELVGYWDYQCQQKVRDAGVIVGGDESEVALYWRDLGFDYAREHASELPRVVALRVLRQFELFRPLQNVTLAGIEGRDRQAGRLGLGMYYGLAALSVVGVRSLRSRGVLVWPLLVQFLAVIITSAYTYGTIRFRAPAEPMLCVLGAAGAVPVLRRVRAWSARGIAARHADAAASSFVGGAAIARRLPCRASLLSGGLVAALIALPLRGLYRTTGGTMEEAFMIVFPERILAGDLPNRDFLHLYGPGALHVLAGWYTAFGYSLWSERTFGLLQHVALIAGIWALARPWGRGAAAMVASVSVFLVLTPVGLTAMAWNGGLALLVWSLVVATRAGSGDDERSARRSMALAGVLAGLALTYRPDLALAVALCFAWMLWRSPRWRPLVTGAAIGLLPMWVHVALVGPSTAVRGMFVDPVFRLRAGRELPRPPSWNRLDGSLQAIAELIPPWWGVPALPAPKSLFVWFFAMLAAPVALWVTARHIGRRRPGSVQARTLMVVALLSIGIVPQALQRPDSTHLSWVSCISFPFLVIAAHHWITWWKPFVSHRRAVMGATAATLALMLAVTPLFTFRYYLLHTRVSLGNVQTPFPVARHGRHFYLGDFFAAEASKQAVADLERLSTPGETLIVGPADLRRTWYSDALFYYLFPELPPGTRFIEMDPGLANEQGGPLAGELRDNDWVILTRFWDGWQEPNSSMDFGSAEPNQVIDERYCLEGSYENGLVELYRRCR
jgi:4-amino-4-deoxy-L-arabinose transferase-like glycosyltransferase